MRFFRLALSVALGFGLLGSLASLRAAAPVTPDALPEAVALLQFLQDISGHYTLTGQHNFPSTAARNSEFAARYTSHMPAVWTSDMGFEADGTDSYKARPVVVAEAIRQHRQGALVSICWHAVPPTADEPVSFLPKPGADPKRLASVQGRLLDEQFRDLLTPGTALHTHWLAQVDAIAAVLKQLEDARVPVLWRPYHEMNGNWFWWGARTEGPYTTAALYRQIFDRLVHHHHLKNLIWVWSVDRMSKPGMEHDKFFPGLEYLDVLALDVYRNDFAQSYYDSLVRLSGGKPLALAEVGNPPSREILAQQPRWTFYAVWAGMVRNATYRQYAELFADPRILNLDSPAYAEVAASYRRACGLPPVAVAPPPAEFSGTWVLDEDASKFAPGGQGSAPARLVVTQTAGALTIQSTVVSEFADDEVHELRQPLDGSDVNSTAHGRPRVSTARLTPDARALEIVITVDGPWGLPPGTKRITRETWTLLDAGRKLSVHSVTPAVANHAATEQTLIYVRR